MGDRDIQNRIIGIALGAFALCIVVVLVIAIWDGLAKAIDSGPMYQPSAWKK